MEIKGKNILSISKEVKINEITKDILEYIKEQYENELLNPLYYPDVLVFIAEVLPYLNSKDELISMGYNICRDIKYNLETYGFGNDLGMFSGVGYKCFAVEEFSKKTNILMGFSNKLNKALLSSLEERINKIKYNELRDYYYDMISGISGVLYHLIDYKLNEHEQKIIIRGIEYLISLSNEKIYKEQNVIGFHIQFEHQNKLFDEHRFREGSINLGMAHGMLGPLILLAKAYSKGIIVNGQEDAIKNMYSIYARFKLFNKNNVPYWPTIINPLEYSAGKCELKNEGQSSWCYGNVGIIRGLMKVSNYMKWTEKEGLYRNDLKNLFKSNIESYRLNSPSLCHGYASVLVVQLREYYSSKDVEMLETINRTVRKVIKVYRNNNYNFSNQRNNTVECLKEELSLLTGSIGVIISLLYLKGEIGVGKLLMID